MKSKNPVLALLLLFLAFSLAGQKTKTAAVKTLAGAPTLLVDGQPELPFFYALTHVSGGRWSWEEMPAHNLRNACADGIRLFQVDLWLEDLWPAGQTRLDMALARRQLRGVLDACPGAGVVVRLHVNAPMWWNRAHPEECVQFADGPVEDYPTGLPFNHEDGDIYRTVRASLASERWRREAGAQVRAFCRDLARSPEGRAVIGLHLSGGVYGEWHPWGFFRHEPDVSAPMQQAFRQWLKTQYGSDARLAETWNLPGATLDSARVPDTLARRCCPDDGIFRDPQHDRQALDFYRCQQEVVAADIEYFCRLVKQNWGRPLITGAFYGYFHFSLCRQAMSGHLEVQRLLDSPWIDYFAGPPSYNRPSRVAGGSGLERSIVPAVLHHGKLWFDEIDNGYLQADREKDFVRSTPMGDSAYLPIFQRSLWLPLMQGCGLWLYDFGPRRNAGWWDGDMYRREIRRTRAFFAQRLGPAPAHPADALVVWDTESFYQLVTKNMKDCERGFDDAAEDLQRCGVGFGQTYLFDLPKVNLRPYKAVLFMNAWKLNAEQRRFIRDSVATDGRTLIWNYLSGYSDGRGLDPASVESLTGVHLEQVAPPDSMEWRLDTFRFRNFETIRPLLLAADPGATPLAYLTDSTVSRWPVLARKPMPNFTSVYAGVALHGSTVFRRLFQDAGCHVWNTRNDLSFPAGGYLLLHGEDQGNRLLSLQNGEWVETELAGQATLLLDAETGVVLLK